MGVTSLSIAAISACPPASARSAAIPHEKEKSVPSPSSSKKPYPPQSHTPTNRRVRPSPRPGDQRRRAKASAPSPNAPQKPHASVASRRPESENWAQRRPLGKCGGVNEQPTGRDQSGKRKPAREIDGSMGIGEPGRGDVEVHFAMKEIFRTRKTPHIGEHNPASSRPHSQSPIESRDIT